LKGGKFDYQPRTVKIFIASLVQLHTLPIKFLLDDKLATTHLFDGVFDLLSGSFAKHGCESAEQLYLFILTRKKESNNELTS
jgi:hypothetical protein